MKLRRLVIALIACAWSLPAAAHCEDEAQAARVRLWNSEPFHFEITRWNRDVRKKFCGEIVPGVAQRERNCDAVTGPVRETVWIGDRRWERDSAGWRGSYLSIWTHQDRMPAPTGSFSAAQVTCFGRVAIDGRAMTKYEFAKQIADRVWVETIFTDEQSGLPVRFETRGRSDASSGATAIYRHDPAIRLDPPSVDLDKRWAESLGRLSQDAQKGDPVCRAKFFSAVQRGRMAAFEFAIKGSFESVPCCLTGKFVPPDAIHYRTFSETIWAGGRAWTKNAYPRDSWAETPGRLNVVDNIVRTLFPPSEYVGQVKCLGGVSVDGREHDWYEYDFYRDRESARTLYSHRSMIVEKATGLPSRTVSISRTNAHQWVETRRYDPALTVQAPAPETIHAQRPEPTPKSPLKSKPADTNWLLPYLGDAGAIKSPPPFTFTPPADAIWPPPTGRQ